MRVAAIVVLVAVGLGAAWWWQAGRGAEAPVPLPSAAGSSPTVDPSFQAFPKDYQPEQVQRSLEGLQAWADS
jgi:cytoskeletal protein RodZ